MRKAARLLLPSRCYFMLEDLSLKPFYKSASLLAALAAAAAIVAGCGGGGGQSSTLVPSTTSGGTANHGAQLSHRILFYSKDYLKQHPELLRSTGKHDQAQRRAMATGSNNLV